MSWEVVYFCPILNDKYYDSTQYGTLSGYCNPRQRRWEAFTRAISLFEVVPTIVEWNALALIEPRIPSSKSLKLLYVLRLSRDSPAGLGAGGPEFKSRRPDQLLLYFRWTVSVSKN
jgi:hypothetical protein